MSRFVSFLLAVSALAVPALAQPFAPSAIDLTAGGALDPDVACVTALDNVDGPVLLWFDGGTESLFVARTDAGVAATAEVVAAGAFDDAAGVDVDGCRGAAVSDPPFGADPVVYLALSAGDVDFVAAVEIAGDGTPTFELLTTPASGAGDGVVGVALVEGALYAAVRDDLNDPPAGGSAPLADGFYRFEPRGEGQTATPVALDPGLSLTGLVATPTDNAPRPGLFALLAVSDESGAPPYRETVVVVDDPTGSPAVGVFADPFAGPLSFGREAGRLVDLAVAVESVGSGGGGVDRTAAVFVLADGPGGVEVVRYPPGGEGGVSATEASILSGAGRAGAYGPNGTASLLYSDNFDDALDALVLIGSSDGGGEDEVLLATGAFVTPTEPGAPGRPSRLTVGPNPFRGRATVEVSLSDADARLSPGAVAVVVVDALGRRVAELYRGPLGPGDHRRLVVEAGPLAAGAYTVVLEDEAGRALQTRRVTVVR